MPLLRSNSLPPYLLFTWRYFTSKKSVNAITIIARITTLSIAIGTAALLIVLSIFNGFEGLVKNLYASFYPDIRIIHKSNPFFEISPELSNKISSLEGIQALSMSLESNGLFQYENNRVNIVLKGVDDQYAAVSGVPEKMIRGKFETGNMEQPLVVIGSGIENALQVQPGKTLIPLTTYLPRKDAEIQTNPIEAISTMNVYPIGSFAIQQDFDNRYAITNIETLRTVIGVSSRTVSSIEIKLRNKSLEKEMTQSIQQIVGNDYIIENRFQQNRTLFGIMQSEKWIIFGILSFILVLASFNMIGTLTLLILEKEKDIQILKALGGNESFVRKVFMGESLLLGMAGGIAGLIVAFIFCFLQQHFHLIPLQGSFVIDYYPVKMMMTDVCIVLTTIVFISLGAGFYPSLKASKRVFSLKS